MSDCTTIGNITACLSSETNNIASTIGWATQMNCNAEQYAWAGFNFMLYCAGLAIIIGILIIVYCVYKDYNPTPKPIIINEAPKPLEDNEPKRRKR